MNFLREFKRRIARRNRVAQPRPEQIEAPAQQPQPAASLPPALAPMVRPQAARHWLMPQLAAITPQYVEQTLRGALAGNHLQAWELFDLMLDTWPTLAKCVQQLTDEVASLKWPLQVYQEEDSKPSEGAQERKRVVAAAVRNMRPDAAADENEFEETVRDIMDGWFKGQVVLETQWHQVIGSRVGTIMAPRCTSWVHPVCYAWDSGRGCLALRDTDALLETGRALMKHAAGYRQSGSALPDGLREFPPDKFLIGIHKAKRGNAMGSALLRPLAWWWCGANFSADWLLNTAQIFGMPFRWAHYATGTPQGTIDAICEMLQNMGTAGWAAFPEGVQLEFKEALKDARNTPQGDFLSRADRYAVLLILRQTLTTDVGDSGSRALGDVHLTIEERLVMSAAKYVARVINRQLVPSILRLNFGDETEPPRFVPQPDAASRGFLREAWKGFQQRHGAIMANSINLKDLATSTGLPVNQEYNAPYLPVRGVAGRSVADKAGDIDRDRSLSAKARARKVAGLIEKDIFGSARK